MKIISMKQLRQKFATMRRSLEKGESFLLMYRSKPLAVIRPYEANKDIHLLVPEEENNKLPAQKPLKTLPEPQKIAIEESKIPQLPQGNSIPLLEKNVKPLDRFKLKKIFS